MKPGCHYCWSPFDKACTDAHLHDCRDNTVRLCWICYSAYDHDLFTTSELADAARVFDTAGRLQCRMNELAAEWIKHCRGTREMHRGPKLSGRRRTETSRNRTDPGNC